MKINEIYIELGQTRSVNFQSSQNRVGLRASLDDGDDVTDSVRNLQQQAAEMTFISERRWKTNFNRRNER